MFLKGLRRRKVIACFFGKSLMFLCKFLIIIFLKFSYVTQSLFRICFSRFRSANYTLRSIQQWNQNLRSVQTKLAHAAQTNEDLKVPEAVWPAAGSITSDDEINILRFCSCVGKAR